MNYFLHITTENCLFIRDIPEGERVDSIKAMIDAEMLESVLLPGNICMLIDECGKLKSKKFNFFASMLYPGYPMDVIVGDAVLAKIRTVEGELDIGPLDSDDLSFFHKLFDFALSLDSLLCKDEVVDNE